MKIDWKRKLSSRKLWAAVAGVVAGLAMVFGLDEGTITSVSGAVVSAASIIAYIISEGKIDAASVQSTHLDSVADALLKAYSTPLTPTTIDVDKETNDNAG